MGAFWNKKANQFFWALNVRGLPLASFMKSLFEKVILSKGSCTGCCIFPEWPKDDPHVGVTTLPLQVMMTLNEFARLCKTSEIQEVVEKLLHATLCMACHFNRLRVVRHLLEVHECDPRCSASKEGHFGCIEGVSNTSG